MTATRIHRRNSDSNSDENKNAPKLAIGCFPNVMITLANWVILAVTRLKSMGSEMRFWIAFFAVVVAMQLAFVSMLAWLDPPPLLLPCLFVVACATLFGTDLISRYRTLHKLDGVGFGDFQIDEPCEYTGIYRPHREIGHIEVPLSRRRLGFIPVLEWWCPRNAPPDYVDCLPESSDPCIIRFVGRVSEPGTYGHMGSMRRKVIV